MEVVIGDWISLLIRWAHVMTGIAWIGTSFFFVWLDASLRKRPESDDGGPDEAVAGESWLVHGGGFYQAEKYMVAPPQMPKELHWFKYEAYFTWITGFLLLAVIYYWGAETYLINPALKSSGGTMTITPAVAVLISVASLALGWLAYDQLCRSPIGRHTGVLFTLVFSLAVVAAWGYGFVFNGRAAMLHVGALMGTIMAANVFFIIIPNQKKVVSDLIAGKRPDPALGAQAKQRSLHNNYLTLPVILFMISNHYPVLYGGDNMWLVVAGILTTGALIRLFFNSHNAGKMTWAAQLSIPAAAIVVILTIAASAPSTAHKDAAAADPVAFSQIHHLVRTHCVSCHGQNPTDENFVEAPGNLILETPAQIKGNASRILKQTVLTDTMPLGNQTNMTAEERQVIGTWIQQGAKIN